tara:strand:- start:2517 stop:3185 length:669 start_codon:yes stop_codon:yes gene_type:complete
MYSVIIRVKNEEAYIGHAIQSCIDRLDKPEIIIVNDNSTDKSLYISRLFISKDDFEDSFDKNYCRLSIINIKDYTPGKAINLGVKHCTNENIIILSSHCTITKFDNSIITKNLEKFGVIFGNQIPFYYGKRIKKNYIWSNFTENEVINMWSESEQRYFFHNAASIFRKDILINNPFDERIAGKEDRYWANSWISKNKKIIYQPAFAVNHHYTSEGNTWKGIG